MGVSPFFVRMGVRTDRTPWKGMLSGSPPAEAEPDSIPLHGRCIQREKNVV